MEFLPLLSHVHDGLDETMSLEHSRFDKIPPLMTVENFIKGRLRHCRKLTVGSTFIWMGGLAMSMFYKVGLSYFGSLMVLVFIMQVVA